MAGIYIHIPFCKQKCKYCDFVSFAGEYDYSSYIAALISEMRLFRELMDGRTFNTVFIGGGTPSLLPSVFIRTILDEARKCFDIAGDSEITIEANPESLTLDKLYEYRDSGINRLSVGLQSGDDDVLRSIGRIHDRNTFIQAFRNARKAGFNNINIDLMHGLPNQSCEAYLESIRLAAQLGAEHISSYSLILEEHTPLFSDVTAGKTILPTEDETADMEDAGFILLKELGYLRYEISNFAKPGYECKHNLNYWDNGEYLGLGLNSHSALHFSERWVRWANEATLSAYIVKAANGTLPVETTETINRTDEMFETIMVGLRKISGVNRHDFMERFGIDPVENYASAISEALLDGTIEVSDEYLRLTNRGLDFQNEVLLKFM